MIRLTILLTALGLVTGCQSDNATLEPMPTAASHAISSTSAHTVGSFDGVTIHYDVQGEGELSLVFVHGWNCDRSYWNAQREVLAQSHRVVTIDLAGHGESSQDRVDWTMQAFGEDVAAVVTALELHNVVLIGHSMGGKVVVEAASQLDSRVVALVGVDTFHNGGGATPRPRHETILAELADDYAGYLEKLVGRMFVEQSDPAIRSFVLKDMSAAPSRVAIGARTASGNYDATPAIESLDVPLILISSDYLPTNLAYLEKYAKTFEYREMTGIGHFVMLEDPHAFNAHLVAALADINEKSE